MANVPLTVYKIWPDLACLMNVQAIRTRCQLWWILFRFLSVNECVNWELIYNQQYSSLVAMHDNQLKSLLCFLSLNFALWRCSLNSLQFINFILPSWLQTTAAVQTKGFCFNFHVIRVDIYTVFKFTKKTFLFGWFLSSTSQFFRRLIRLIAELFYKKCPFTFGNQFKLVKQLIFNWAPLYLWDWLSIFSEFLLTMNPFFWEAPYQI